MHACTLRYTFNLVCLEVRYSARSGFLLSHSSKDRAFNMSNNRSKHLIKCFHCIRMFTIYQGISNGMTENLCKKPLVNTHMCTIRTVPELPSLPSSLNMNSVLHMPW